MVAPLKEYYSAYKEVDEKATALNDELGKIQNYIDDSVKGQFNTYDTSLKDAAASFSGGMTAANRAQIENLRKTYGRTIVPIQDAITNKQKAVETQATASLRDQSIIFEDVAYDHSLAEFMNNPTLTQNSRHVSLNDVQDEAYKLAQHLNSQLTGYGQAGQLDEDTGLFMQSHGLKPEDIISFNDSPEARNTKAQKWLGAIYDEVYKNSGVAHWTGANASNTQTRVKEAIASGMWSAVGGQNVTTYSLPKKETPVAAELSSIETYEPDVKSYYETNGVGRWTEDEKGMVSQLDTNDKGNYSTDQYIFQINSKGNTKAAVLNNVASRAVQWKDSDDNSPHPNEDYVTLDESSKADYGWRNVKSVKARHGSYINIPNWEIWHRASQPEYYQNDVEISHIKVWKAGEGTGNDAGGVYATIKPKDGDWNEHLNLKITLKNDADKAVAQCYQNIEWAKRAANGNGDYNNSYVNIDDNIKAVLLNNKDLCVAYIEAQKTMMGKIIDDAIGSNITNE